jgi:C-terminal processing protease CtpA/Prc
VNKLTRLFAIIGCTAILLGACSPQAPAQTEETSSSGDSPSLQTNSDEPVLVTGTIPFTSPFFLAGNSEPFILLEDEAGFIERNREFVFPLSGQAIGPVELVQDGLLSFSLPLPSVPQATLSDVDHDGQEDQGVMIFVVAYWSNTWGGPFLEERDGTGWSTAYMSTTTDPNRDDEIDGGTMIIWAPDDKQSFPSGFGEDEKLFTEDDPIADFPAGYSFVDLDADPFRVYKQPTLELVLNEGASAVNDFSEMSYTDAFETMFTKVSTEYPFTQFKDLDWDAIHAQIAPMVASATNDDEFYVALRDLTYMIPDAHVGISFNPNVFWPEIGGEFGLVLDQLDDGKVVVTRVLPGSPAEQAGIESGAEIITWGGQPAADALEAVHPYFAPFSTEQHELQQRLIFLPRVPAGGSIELSFASPGGSEQQATMQSVEDVQSYFAADPISLEDQLSTPVYAEVLDSGIGYIKVNDFQDDYNLTARLYERAVQGLIDNSIPALIIDLRVNYGGSGGLALDFSDYFYDEEVVLWNRESYNPLLDEFELGDFPARIKSGSIFYEGPIAVLVSPSCISACEGFAYALTSTGRAIAVGTAGTAGAFGDVGFGQYTMPGGWSMQFPTGRPIDANGNVVIEGVGIQPDIVVPKTLDSVLGVGDPVLEAAVQALLDKLQ